VIRVYDEPGNVIETHDHAGDYKEPSSSVFPREAIDFFLRHALACNASDETKERRQ